NRHWCAPAWRATNGSNIATPAIGVNDAVGIDLAPDDGLQRGFGGIGFAAQFCLVVVAIKIGDENQEMSQAPPVICLPVVLTCCRLTHGWFTYSHAHHLDFHRPNRPAGPACDAATRGGAAAGGRGGAQIPDRLYSRQRVPGRRADLARSAPVHGVRQSVPGLDGFAGPPRSAQR